MMNIPGKEYQTTRSHLQGGKTANASFTQKAQTSTDCNDLCSKHGKCLTWVFDKNSSTCFLYETINLNSYNGSTESGLKGNWYFPYEASGCLTFSVPGTSPPSGNITSCPVQSEGVNISSVLYRLFENLWADFRINGRFAASTKPSNSEMLHGANAMNMLIPPHGNKTVTFIMTWNYPHRDFKTETPGNQYSLFYPSTEDAASYMNTDLLNIVRNISALHDAFTSSSLAPFLQDIFINSLSHIRSAIWFRDGRYARYSI